jgi:homoserine dehydrogenase
VSGSLADGEPSRTHLRLALGRGWHAVTATKVGLVRHYAELQNLARDARVQLRFGAATAAALPTVDFAASGLRGATVERFEGILNGTSNFILSQMSGGRMAYADALAEAQRRGIAEPDPRLDVEGWDTACKLVLIANATWDAGLSLEDVNVTGIQPVTPEWLTQADRHGQVVKLIGSLERRGGQVIAEVGPRELGFDHPLAHVNGTEKGATFRTDTLGVLTVTGGKSDPRGAAAALLRDILHIAAV